MGQNSPYIPKRKRGVFRATHRKAIAFIHLALRARRFAPLEVRVGAAISESATARVLRRLVELKMLKHYKSGYHNKVYECSTKWEPEVMKNIEVYELADLLGL